MDGKITYGTGGDSVSNDPRDFDHLRPLLDPYRCLGCDVVIRGGINAQGDDDAYCVRCVEENA